MQNIKLKIEFLRDKMELFDLFQQDDEVGQALKDLETEVDSFKSGELNEEPHINNDKTRKTFILVGEQAITYFENRNWEELEKLILENQNGDIVAWNKETSSVGSLLDMLSGWNDFIELSEESLKTIEANTKIEILWN